MKLDRFQIETMRGVLRDYWKTAGHSHEPVDALCDMALQRLGDVPSGIDGVLLSKLGSIAYQMDKEGHHGAKIVNDVCKALTVSDNSARHD